MNGPAADRLRSAVSPKRSTRPFKLIGPQAHGLHSCSTVFLKMTIRLFCRVTWRTRSQHGAFAILGERPLPERSPLAPQGLTSPAPHSTCDCGAREWSERQSENSAVNLTDRKFALSSQNRNRCGYLFAIVLVATDFFACSRRLIFSLLPFPGSLCQTAHQTLLAFAQGRLLPVAFPHHLPTAKRTAGIPQSLVPTTCHLAGPSPTIEPSHRAA